MHRNVFLFRSCMLAAMEKTTWAASKVSLVRNFCSCKVLHQIIKKQPDLMEGLNFLQNLQSSPLNHEKKNSDQKGMNSVKLCKVLHQIINLFFQSSRLQFCSCKLNLHKMIHVKIWSDLKGLVNSAIANSDLILSLRMLSSKNNLLGILRSRWQ